MAARKRPRAGIAAAAPAKPKAPAPKAKAIAGKAAAKGNARTSAGKPEVRIFVSYSHFDAAARTKLETHLAPLVRDGVRTWFDGNMDPGDPLDASISKALRQAHILVALLSPEYISSRYCQIEYERAMARRARGTMRVVAVVVRPCGWKETKAAGFKLLPEDGRNVLEWRSADAAFLDVAQGIAKLVRTIRAGMAETPAKATPIRSKAEPAVKAPSKAKPPARRPAKARTASPKPNLGKPNGVSTKAPPSKAKAPAGPGARDRPVPKARRGPRSLPTKKR